MTKIKAIIKNNAGIHVRPSGVIMSEIMNYSGKIVISTKDTSVEVNSVIALLTLGLMKDDEVEISVSGPDEKEICIKTKELFERIYDFPPRN